MATTNQDDYDPRIDEAKQFLNLCNDVNSNNRAEEAVEKALQNPLLDVDVTGASGAVINIIGGPDLSLDEAKKIYYKKIEEIPFEVVLDLATADLTSSGKIPVEFRNIPPFVSSLRVTPAKVDFLIEKKIK